MKDVIAKIIRYVAQFLPKYEYYLDYETGVVKRRRMTSKMGSYKYIDGKIVKTSGNANFTYDPFTFMGWTEQMTGTYDEALGYIGGKEDYRNKMKAKGWIPKESFKYSKKNVQQRVAEGVAKREKQKDYDAFNRAVSIAESRTGHRFN
jgi:hypothetical protein